MKKSNLRTGLTLFLHTVSTLTHYFPILTKARAILLSQFLFLFLWISISISIWIRIDQLHIVAAPSLRFIEFPNRFLQLATQLPMATEKLMAAGGPRYVQMKSSPPTSPPSADIASSLSFRHSAVSDLYRIFDELPKATIVSVSRPDPSDISPMQLSYTIEVEYKQVRSLFLFLWFCRILQKWGRRISDRKLWSELRELKARGFIRNWILYFNLISSLYTVYVCTLVWRNEHKTLYSHTSDNLRKWKWSSIITCTSVGQRTHARHWTRLQSEVSR